MRDGAPYPPGVVERGPGSVAPGGVVGALEVSPSTRWRSSRPPTVTAILPMNFALLSWRLIFWRPLAASSGTPRPPSARGRSARRPTRRGSAPRGACRRVGVRCRLRRARRGDALGVGGRARCRRVGDHRLGQGAAGGRDRSARSRPASLRCVVGCSSAVGSSDTVATEHLLLVG